MATEQHVEIREATPDDCEAIMVLAQELAMSLSAVQDSPKITADTLRKYGFGEHKLFSCIVAVDQYDIVGYALYFISFSTYEGVGVFMEDLFVRPSHRHRGIGGRLWKEVAKVAVQKGSNLVELKVQGWDAALDMYKAKGAVDRTTDHDIHAMRLTGNKLVQFAESDNK